MLPDPHSRCRNLPGQGSRATAKYAWDTQRMVDCLDRKSLEKFPHVHISCWWAPPPASFLRDPHLGKAAPSTARFAQLGICPGDEGEGGATNETQALGVCTGTGHLISNLEEDFPKGSGCPGNRNGTRSNPAAL